MAEPPQRLQVAAVCFRILSTGVEFLLVRTRRGRWTFPKGGIQAGLTHAQSAALEAYEEAGVHGRIEESWFARYTLRKFTRDGEASETQRPINAHLCEVLQLASPQEPNRSPTWFSPTKAKRRLAEGRTRENAVELAHIVDRALARIRRLPARTEMANDPLLEVKFEASETDVHLLIEKASMMLPRGRARGQGSRAPVLESSAMPGRGKVLQLRPVQPKRP